MLEMLTGKYKTGESKNAYADRLGIPRVTSPLVDPLKPHARAVFQATFKKYTHEDEARRHKLGVAPGKAPLLSVQNQKLVAETSTSPDRDTTLRS